jgi:protein involved in polysaccharide export with SLBB domain
LISKSFLQAMIAAWALAIASPASAFSQSTVSAPGAIRPGDVIRLRIWREPDLSGDFSVGANGVAVLPRLGAMNMAVIPADSLQAVLGERYKEFLNNPSIEALLLRRVTITGAVRNPGVYPLDPTLTISDAVALAGGPAPDGKRDRVEIRRAGVRVAADLRNDTIVSDSPIQSGDQIYVPTKAWLSRNTWLISAAVTLTAVVVREMNR